MYAHSHVAFVNLFRIVGVSSSKYKQQSQSAYLQQESSDHYKVRVLEQSTSTNDSSIGEPKSKLLTMTTRNLVCIIVGAAHRAIAREREREGLKVQGSQSGKGGKERAPGAPVHLYTHPPTTSLHPYTGPTPHTRTSAPYKPPNPPSMSVP